MLLDLHSFGSNFRYGHTAETDQLVQIIDKKYVEPKIMVGFSMGGNIVAKYLTEKPERQKLFVSMVNVCQGYDILRASHYMMR